METLMRDDDYVAFAGPVAVARHPRAPTAYSCILCGISVTTKGSFKKHVQHIHFSMFECKGCGVKVDHRNKKAHQINSPCAKRGYLERAHEQHPPHVLLIPSTNTRTEFASDDACIAALERLSRDDGGRTDIQCIRHALAVLSQYNLIAHGALIGVGATLGHWKADTRNQQPWRSLIWSDDDLPVVKTELLDAVAQNQFTQLANDEFWTGIFQSAIRLDASSTGVTAILTSSPTPPSHQQAAPPPTPAPVAIAITSPAPVHTPAPHPMVLQQPLDVSPYTYSYNYYPPNMQPPQTPAPPHWNTSPHVAAQPLPAPPHLYRRFSTAYRTPHGYYDTQGNYFPYTHYLPQ